MTSNVILQHFDILAKQGIKPIPLRHNSKRPWGKEWNKSWNHDKSRWIFQCDPTLNMGLLLGDIVDVEGDSQEANEKINKLIKDYPHPVYTSTKSDHHLFLNPDPNLNRLQYQDIEFRGHNHQSVLPPSKHQGVFYRWKKNSVWPIPPMPEDLLNFYWQIQRKRKRRKNLVKPNHVKLWCGECEKECFMHQKRFDSELRLFRMMGQKWQCHGCRKIDMRPLVRRHRKGLPALSSSTKAC